MKKVLIDYKSDKLEGECRIMSFCTDGSIAIDEDTIMACNSETGEVEIEIKCKDVKKISIEYL